MPQAHTLKSLRVNEISLVDVPANPGAMHLLFKRKESPAMPRNKAGDGPLDRLLAKLGLISKSGETRDPVDPETYIEASANEIDKAATALDQSIASILADASVTDKTGEIAKSMADFRAYLGDKVPDQIEKAMRDVAMVTLDKKDDPNMPTMDDLGAQVAELTKQLKTTQAELAKAKLSPAHAKYASDMGMDDDATAAFAAKSADERDAIVSAKPVKKQADPASVELTKALNEVSDLQKRVASFEAERELTEFRKRAIGAGLAETHAETILKASKGDAAAFEKMMDLMKAANHQAKTGAIFKEFGSVGAPSAGSAAAEVTEKAETLMKADPKLSMIAARVQVRKANTELAQRERDEERAAIRAVS